MNTARFLVRLVLPLTKEEELDQGALEAHLADQWKHGIGGILVAGTMGHMQLLRDQTYRQLAMKSIEFSKNAGEIMVGAGDCSYYRTLDRIRFLNDLRIDGVVVLTPFFIRFSQKELIQYYSALADECKAPLYLYDLPQRTQCKIELETTLQLAKHPNIRGIKCSDEPSYARRIVDILGDSFRVIVAQPMLVDVFLKFGIYEHLDGMFAVAPELTVSIGKYAAAGDWARNRCAEEVERIAEDSAGLWRKPGIYGAWSMRVVFLATIPFGPRSLLIRTDARHCWRSRRSWSSWRRHLRQKR